VLHVCGRNPEVVASLVSVLSDSKVKVLHLTDSGLTSILPRSLNEKSLVALDLSRNQFSGTVVCPAMPCMMLFNISGDADGKSELNELVIDDRMPELRMLIARNNNLSAAPSGLSDGKLCPELRAVYLGHNRLASFPFAELADRLRQLDLGYNMLSGDLVVPSMPLLVWLNLEYNRLTSTELRGPFPELESLYINDNRLMSLKLRAVDCPRLKRVLTHNNQLEDLPLEFPLSLSDLYAADPVVGIPIDAGGNAISAQHIVDVNDRIIQGADSKRKNQDSETEVKQMSQDSNSQMDTDSPLPASIPQPIVKAPQDLCNQFYAEKSVALMECYKILRAKLPDVYDVRVCDYRYSVVPGPVLCVFTFEEVKTEEVLPHIPRDLLELPLRVCCTSSSNVITFEERESVEDLKKHWVACLEAWRGIQDQVPLLLSNPNISGVSFSADATGPLILLFCLPYGYSVYGAPRVPEKVHHWRVERYYVTLKPCAIVSNRYAYFEQVDDETSFHIRSTVGGYIRRDSDGAVFGVSCGHKKVDGAKIYSKREEKTFVLSEEVGHVERIFFGNVDTNSQGLIPVESTRMVDAPVDVEFTKDVNEHLKGLDFSLIRTADLSSVKEGLSIHKLDFGENLFPPPQSPVLPEVVMRNEVFDSLRGELRPLHTRIVEADRSHCMFFYNNEKGEITSFVPPGCHAVLFNQALLTRRKVQFRYTGCDFEIGGCSGSWVTLANNEKCVVGSFIRSDSNCEWSVVCPLLPFLEHLESNPEHGECTLLLSSPNTSPANCKYL
jgi:Leucine-rich repeat (LRR) protein